MGGGPVVADGPKAIFTDAVRWLRERDVLLPGVTQCHGDKAVCVRLRQPEFGYDA